MKWTEKTKLYCTPIKNRLFFLDITENSYLCFECRNVPEFLRLVKQARSTVDSEPELHRKIHKRLSEIGIDIAINKISRIEISDHSARIESDFLSLNLNDDDVKVEMSDIVRFAAAFLRAKIELAIIPLHTICSRVERKRSLNDAESSSDPRQLGVELQKFHSIRPFFYTYSDQCLLNALVLIHFLLPKNFQISWVFGIQDMPFKAHCWVQADNVLLSDRFDLTAHFKPIMTI